MQRERSQSFSGSSAVRPNGLRRRNSEGEIQVPPEVGHRTRFLTEQHETRQLSNGQKRRDFGNPNTPFLRKKALEAHLGNDSRARKLGRFNQPPQPLQPPRPLAHDHLPPPAIMHATQPQAVPKIGQEGDNLVFSHPKQEGDMVHFSSDEGATAIGEDNVMYPSLLDSRPVAHFGPGVYFTDRQTIDESRQPGEQLSHDTVQRAIYTQASPQNAQRSAQVIQARPEIYRQRPVNTYEILNSRLPEMRERLNERRRLGGGDRPNLAGVSAEWHGGDTDSQRRRVHKVEGDMPMQLPLSPAQPTPAWTRGQAQVGQPQPIQQRASEYHAGDSIPPSMDIDALRAEFQRMHEQRRGN